MDFRTAKKQRKLINEYFFWKIILPNLEIQFAVRAFYRIHFPLVPCCTYPFDGVVLVVEELFQWLLARFAGGLCQRIAAICRRHRHRVPASN
jgi:hypothetical protein